MKKQIPLFFCLFILGTTACKKGRSELFISEIRTLNDIKTPGIKEEFLLNQQVTFYVYIEKENKPKVVYTMRENYANNSTVIGSRSVSSSNSHYDARFDYTPKQNKDLVTLELRVTCGNEVITRYKYIVVK